jgi:hypothetical protein
MKYIIPNNTLHLTAIPLEIRASHNYSLSLRPFRISHRSSITSS